MTSLKLNESIEKFKEFYGKNSDQMPQLIKEGRVPLSVAGLMRRRLEVLNASENARNMRRTLEILNASEDVMDAWWTNYFDTGDAVFYHPNGNIKVVLDAEPMKNLNPESKLSGGALVLPEGLYDKLDGENFTREEIGRYGIAGKLLTKEEAKKNPIWKAFAGGDRVLLDSYVDAVFKEAKEQYGHDKLNMKIWLSQPQKVTTGRLWCIGRLINYSDAFGDCDRGSSGGGRLVGVAP